jgi:predicted RNA-binding protein with PUA domain
MLNVHEVNVTQPPDWRPTPEQVKQIAQALLNEAYPPAGRTRVGTVLRGR